MPDTIVETTESERERERREEKRIWRLTDPNLYFCCRS